MSATTTCVAVMEQLLKHSTTCKLFYPHWHKLQPLTGLVGVSTMHVLHALLTPWYSRLRNERLFWPSQADMAQAAGIHVRTFRRGVACLRRHGLIAVEKQLVDGRIQTRYCFASCIPLPYQTLADEQPEPMESTKHAVSPQPALESEPVNRPTIKNPANPLGQLRSPKSRPPKPPAETSDTRFEQMIAIMPGEKINHTEKCRKKFCRYSDELQLKIIEGAKRYAKWYASAEADQRRFFPRLPNFLDGGWETTDAGYAESFGKHEADNENPEQTSGGTTPESLAILKAEYAARTVSSERRCMLIVDRYMEKVKAGVPLEQMDAIDLEAKQFKEATEADDDALERAGIVRKRRWHGLEWTEAAKARWGVGVGAADRELRALQALQRS